jgi:hypothetical protein
MNYPVLGLGVFLMLLAGLTFGMPEVSQGVQLALAGIGLALALYAVFLHGGGQKLTGGKRIKDNWV